MRALLLLISCMPCLVLAQVSAIGDYLARMDGDADDRVSLNEYLEWMRYGFDARDRNGDGVLSGDELPGGDAQSMTRGQHRARLIATFRKQDANGDGYLSAKELAAPPR